MRDLYFSDEEHRFTLEEAKALADAWEKSYPRPPKRVRDVNVLKAFRLANAGEPCWDCELRPGVHVHHIVFRSQSGDDDPLNLAWLCQSCHDARHGL